MHFRLARKLTLSKVKIPRISIPGCTACTQHRVTLKNGTTGVTARITTARERRSQNMGRTGNKMTAGNPSSIAVETVGQLNRETRQLPCDTRIGVLRYEMSRFCSNGFRLLHTQQFAQFNCISLHDIGGRIFRGRSAEICAVSGTTFLRLL